MGVLTWEQAKQGKTGPDALVEVFAVVFEPAGDASSVGGFEWTPDRAVADRVFADMVGGDPASRVVRLYRVWPSASWSRAAVTDYVDEVLVENDPTTPPLREHLPAARAEG